MNHDSLQDFIRQIRGERGNNASSSGAGPSEQSLLQRELLSFMQGSRGYDRDRRGNDRDREEDYRGRMRRDEVEDMYQQMRRGPRDFHRGRYGSDDDDSPERYNEISTEPQFTIRADVEYKNIMGLFERNSAHLRNKGFFSTNIVLGFWS